jgi:hypothetical protein
MTYTEKTPPQGTRVLMRINYCEEEERPGQFALWDANCRRSIQGRAGQAALRRLEAALVAMPDKRLVSGKLVTHDGDVCAIGALARAEGKLPEPEMLDPDGCEYDDCDDTAEFAETRLNFPHLVAWKVVAENDLINDVIWEMANGPLQRHEAVYRGPDGHGYGVPFIRPMTPEERYERVLQWVREQLKASS